jgi:transcriptional regulator with XRE-family HTH domain
MIFVLSSWPAMSRIGELRRQRGLTQEELARRVRVSVRAVAAWESGNAIPRHRNARALARALGVPVETLVPAASDSPSPTAEEAGR